MGCKLYAFVIALFIFQHFKKRDSKKTAFQLKTNRYKTQNAFCILE